ncbi:VIT1/CCC1 transporter family protein [Alicyclobacillus sp. SO9]|uniref:VIT1/CCC1 transporter family protein n=1 Tax=Alicyclobacillus sp. SO9 TaxID=2665646 RepID=UPI0018E8C307|nr:VIT1/CCC1 transporter family protein [Alicyclobacillus sp. SO9]QQE80996.1 VIT1/CCC1 transporter family protein [Alicyclobacillus sp. SO9]
MVDSSAEAANTEKHFRTQEVVRDIIIGMADGLTVPFALAAGLSGAVSNTWLIVTAGLAEIAAGSIAMGLGGYLAVKSDHEYYEAEMERERQEIRDMPEAERREVEDIIRRWGFHHHHVEPAVNTITDDNDKWIDFMMQYELRLERPRPERARNSSLTIGISYIIGGLVPLAPYFLFTNAAQALLVSVIFTILALFIFGYVKARFIGTRAWRSAFQMALVGGLAALVAFLAAKYIA